MNRCQRCGVEDQVDEVRLTVNDQVQDQRLLCRGCRAVIQAAWSKATAAVGMAAFSL